MEIHRNIPRTQRFGIGYKIDFLFLEFLELIRKSAYSPISEKIKLLEQAISKIDSIRFFIQLLWEIRLLPNNQYINLGADIENLGKMVGGWKKGIISKQTKPST